MMSKEINFVEYMATRCCNSVYAIASANIIAVC